MSDEKPVPGRRRRPSEKMCGFPGCGRPFVAHGFCKGHVYQLGTGRPLRPIGNRLPLGASPEQRFWVKVNKNGPVVRPELGPCWMWTAATHDGYGWFIAIKSDGPLLAHRYSWSLKHGDAGELLVCHHCDNRPCVRPDHLFLGTITDNAIDAARKLRLGHKLDPDRVREIRAAHAAGASRKDLTVRYGVSARAIDGVVTGEWWKHVTPANELLARIDAAKAGG